MPLPDVVSGLLLSPRPPVRARAGVPGRQKEPTPFRFRLAAKTALMLAPSSFSESNPLRWASIRVFKVISRRRRRLIDRWCCFSFPNRTHFIGLRFGSHQGANTVPFPPHGENCTMLAPSFFSESNPLRWASIYFFYNKAGKHNLCLPAFAYSFGFPFLLFEKRYHNGAGARMGSDHTSYGRIANFFQFSLPDVTAVFDIL